MAKTLLNYNFAENVRKPLPRTTIKMPYTHDTTIDFDYLYPLHRQELLPGDEIQCSTHIYCRLATPKRPLMHNLFLHTYYFAMPVRQVWEHLRQWFGERTDYDDSIDYEIPIVDLSSSLFNSDTIYDYLGAPIGIQNIEFHAWWTRMYYHVWNNWFRNRMWQDALVVDVDDGPDAKNDYELQKINNQFDFITTLLPEPQMGDPILLPLGDTAPVVGTGNTLGLMTGTPGTGEYFGLYNDATSSEGEWKMTGDTSSYDVAVGTVAAPGDDVTVNRGIGVTTEMDKSGMQVDLSEAVGPSINDFREAIQKQSVLELRARTGNSYREILIADWSVRPLDQTLNYPEYLGGSRQYINVHQVIQQSQSDTTPMGTASAYIDCWDKSGYYYCASEPTLIMGLVAITAEMKYQEMLPRIDSYRSLDEYPHPLLMNLGEQTVYMRELICRGDAADDYVIGYSEAWAERRFNFNIVTSKMRSKHTTSVDVWHCARDFTAAGENVTRDTDVVASIMKSNVPTRFMETGYEAQAFVSCLFDIKNTRTMPMHSIPANFGNL